MSWYFSLVPCGWSAVNALICTLVPSMYDLVLSPCELFAHQKSLSHPLTLNRHLRIVVICATQEK